MRVFDEEMDDRGEREPRKRRSDACQCLGDCYPQGGCPGPANCPLADAGDDEEE